MLIAYPLVAAAPAPRFFAHGPRTADDVTAGERNRIAARLRSSVTTYGDVKSEMRYASTASAVACGATPGRR